MNTPESLNGMVSDLIRRGLPGEYAQRAAAEFADHHRDLVEELRASGWSESQASDEASRRLGDSRALVKKTVGEYQRRYWCARWPLITFLIGPIPALLAAWFAYANLAWLIVVIVTKLGLTTTTDSEAAFQGLPMEIKHVALMAMFLIVPAVGRAT